MRPSASPSSYETPSPTGRPSRRPGPSPPAVVVRLGGDASKAKPSSPQVGTTPPPSGGAARPCATGGGHPPGGAGVGGGGDFVGATPEEGGAGGGGDRRIHRRGGGLGFGGGGAGTATAAVACGGTRAAPTSQSPLGARPVVAEALRDEVSLAVDEVGDRDSRGMRSRNSYSGQPHGGNLREVAEGVLRLAVGVLLDHDDRRVGGGRSATSSIGNQSAEGHSGTNPREVPERRARFRSENCAELRRIAPELRRVARRTRRAAPAPSWRRARAASASRGCRRRPAACAPPPQTSAARRAAAHRRRRGGGGRRRAAPPTAPTARWWRGGGG